MPSPSRFTNTTRKLEDDLPSGELQRAFYRLQGLERTLGYIIERVAALEGAPRAAEAARETAAAPRRAL
jgi:hypothetical protein